MTKQQTIITARKKLGLSQKDFAALLEKKQSTISKWESGKRQPSNLDIREVLRLVNGE